MKYAILVGDGMGDYPVEELGGKTPLQAAEMPFIRRIAAAGETIPVRTVPEGMPPGSDVANMALLGYDAALNYTGRAPIEAAGAGIPLAPEDVAFRCNLVTVSDDGRMADYSAGHISTEEARELIAALQEALGREGLTFHPGVQYRHLLVWRDGPAECRCEPPHEITGRPVAEHLPEGPGAEAVRELMERSREVLADYPVNRRRIAEGKAPANRIWLWGQGRAMKLQAYRERYGLGGGVISAVDLMKGLAHLAGLEAPAVEGATGFLDTNFEGKVAAAQEILRREDFVFIHIEAPDECGHMGDARKKVEAIELFDRRVVAPMFRFLEETGEPYALVICTDHRTPVSLKGHTAEPVPMTILRGPVGDLEGAPEAPFDEFVGEAAAAVRACERIDALLAGRRAAEE